MFLIVVNVALILNLTYAQSDEIGRMQLDVIRGYLQDTLTSAEENLLHAAIRAEQLYVQQCLQADMNEHLSKPKDIDVLKLALGKLISMRPRP